MNRRLLLWITFGVSAALIIAGFLLPPMAVIDNSVLIAVGELWFFGVLAYFFIVDSNNNTVVSQQLNVGPLTYYFEVTSE